jgi:preprotein translocase subunit SecF
MSAVDQTIATSAVARAYRGQTAIDFVGKRRIALGLSALLLILTIGSLFVRGLDLGIDFRGGISWDVPGNSLTIAEAGRVLEDNGFDPAGARIQRRSSDSGDFIKIQVSEQPVEVQERLQIALAAAAGVEFDDVSVNIVSSSWGREITDKAIRALIIFTLVVAAFISIRFEWRMAVAAIAAMVHDVVVSVGIYSLLGLVVTPATVIAFLTILGYSLYDTIVIFDRVRENEAKFATARVPYADVINTTMNQVLMRTLNTTLSSMIPVLSILIIGAGIMGASALSEFAVALLVGMLTGAYSSIFVAAPLLMSMRGSDDRWKGGIEDRVQGDALRQLVMGATVVSLRSRTKGGQGAVQGSSQAPASGRRGPMEAVGEPEGASAATGVMESAGDGAAASSASSSDPARVLSHPPRPRRKKRRR